MVIDNFHIVDAITLPSETDAPLIADANAIQPGPIALKSLQSIPRWYIQFIECGDRIDLNQFAHRYAGDRVPAAARSGLEERPGFLFREAFNHSFLLYNEFRYTTSVMTGPPRHAVQTWQADRARPKWGSVVQRIRANARYGVTFHWPPDEDRSGPVSDNAVSRPVASER